MKKCFWYLMMFLGLLRLSYGQSVNISHWDKNVLANIPKEKVYVHFNSPLLLAGEYLHYKIYVLNPANKMLTSLSDIAYVELVGNGDTVVFRQKIRLENGQGNGDFFIPVSVPSGSYKLLAYTQWMKNQGEHSFFEDDISIINPYQANQKSILDSGGTDEKVFYAKDANKSIIDPGTDKQHFGKREKVTVSLNTLVGNTKGNYSISVHQKAPINVGKNSTSASFLNNLSAIYDSISNPSVYLPELRGELISGKVIAKSAEKNNDDLKIGFSIPGNEGYVLKLATTNKEGRFYINIDEKYNGNRAIVQVVDEDKEEYELVLDKPSPIDYSDLNFRKFYISLENGDYIKQRSVHNQIENGYFSAKPDSILIHKTANPFKSKENIRYNLDDYTRFSTIRETFIEVIENAWATKDRNGNYVFQVRGLTTSTDYFGSADLKSMVILDGVLIQDHNSLIDFDARKVQNIILNRNRYVYGDSVFKGVIIIETIDGDYKLPLQGDYIKFVDLLKPAESKKYFQQQYNDENRAITDRVPDFRYQLYWQPNIGYNTKTVTFFTSDVKGDFEISLEGFTDNGTPISVRKTIIVE